MAYCKIMGTKKISFLLIIVIILAVSCLSGPETITPEVEQPQTQVQTPAQTQTPEPQAVVVQTPAEPVFDPATISRAQRDATMVEVQQFIVQLNQIIRSRNYNSWRNALSQEYFNRISSPEFLQNMSNQPAMTSQKIVLRTPQDYFNNVVVPSRANDHVDDIEFISNNRVRAITINTSGTRLILYDLEKIENSWKIIN